MNSITVCICGHVDSGKTRFTDNITNLKVMQKQAGRITQKLSIYSIQLAAIIEKYNIKVTKNFDVNKLSTMFLLDTPGHDVFESIKMKGIQVSDIILLFTPINKQVSDSCFKLIKYFIEYSINFLIVFTKLDEIVDWKPFVKETFRHSVLETDSSYNSLINERILEFAKHELDLELYHGKLDYCRYTVISNVSHQGYKDLFSIILYESSDTKKIVNDYVVLDMEIGTTSYLTGILYNGQLRVGNILQGETNHVIKRLYQQPYQNSTFKKLLRSPTVFGAQVQSDTPIKVNNRGLILKSDNKGSLDGLYKRVQEKGWPVLRMGLGKVKNIDKISVRNEVPPFNKILYLGKGKSSNTEIVHANIFNIIRQMQEYIHQYYTTEYNQFLNVVKGFSVIELLREFIFKDKPPYVIGCRLIFGEIRTGSSFLNCNHTIVIDSLQIQNKPVTRIQSPNTKFAAKIISNESVNQIISAPIYVRQILRQEYMRYQKVIEYNIEYLTSLQTKNTMLPIIKDVLRFQ